MDNQLFSDIINQTKIGFKGDNAFKGLQIIAKYINPDEKSIISGVSNDIIYSIDIDDLINAGITKDDVINLAMLGWSINNDFYHKCLSITI